jgi:hypothetical protein
MYVGILVFLGLDQGRSVELKSWPMQPLQFNSDVHIQMTIGIHTDLACADVCRMGFK